jgi:PqqD family protein of HPr-rel-A system
MNVQQKLGDLAVSDSGFVFDPYTGSTFSVNGSGRAILEGLKQGHSREAIVEALEREFDIQGPADLTRDLDEFLHLLRQNGLLPPSFLL